MPEFISPRKIEEQVRDYKRQRFESYMGQVDRGEMSRQLAIQALREEIYNIDEEIDGQTSLY